MSDQEQFESLLRGFLAPDSNLISQSEQAYEGIPVDQKVGFLLRAITKQDATKELNSLAAVLLRRLMSTSFEEWWKQLDNHSQTALKQDLLAAVQQACETGGMKGEEASLRKKICDVVAELARSLIDENGNNQWPEILKFLFEWGSSPNAARKECALSILAAVPGIFGGQMGHYLDVIRELLQQCLIFHDCREVRYAAVKALTAFLLHVESEQHVVMHFKGCLPAILQNVLDSVQSDDDDVLKCLIELAENVPKFLRPQLEQIVELSLKINIDSTLDDSWRQLALEVLVTMCEISPASMRKHANKFLHPLIGQMLTMMVELEDDPEWSLADSIQEEDNDSNAIVAETSLDRLACALGGKTVLPLLLSQLAPMLHQDDWRLRYAALMTLSATGEGCRKQMEMMLDQIVDAILPFLRDSHPRVRYAACNAIGQMSTDMAPLMQKKFHAKIVPGLLMVLDDEMNPRTQAHAGAALVNFSEDCPKSVLSLYLDELLSKLHEVLVRKLNELVTKGRKLVLEQCITTLASVADTAQDKFIAYYDRFMPNLKYIFENANSAELKLLRGKAIECISLMGLAVGKDKFMQDCTDVMQLLLKTQSEMNDLETDDPQVSYMISAWARICKILGKQFEQYLPAVMGPVMKAASLKPEVTVLDDDEAKELDEEEWQVVQLGDQQNFGIKTAGLEEKATACSMLVCYARELKEGFVPFVEDVAKLMVPFLKFYFHDGVRSAAAESLPFLLECAGIRGAQYVTEMWQFMVGDLLTALKTEPEPDVLGELMHSLARCVEHLGKGRINEDQMRQIIEFLDEKLRNHFDKDKERQEQRQDEDYDEELEEILLDETESDVYLLSKVSDIIHAFFIAYRQEFFPVFDQLIHHFIQLLANQRSYSDRQWSLCIWDDVIEFGGSSSLRYQQHFLRPMIVSLSDPHPEVRQAAAYGIGVMGMFGGAEYAQACSEALPSLVQMICAVGSREPEALSATENAIAAVTKVLKHNSSMINVDEILPHWFTWLPVWEDMEEAPHVYGLLCDLVEQNHPAVLGANNSQLPRVVAVIAEAFAREAVGPDTPVGRRMISLVQQIQGNGDLFQLCVSPLSDEQKSALQSAMSVLTIPS